MNGTVDKQAQDIGEVKSGISSKLKIDPGKSYSFLSIILNRYKVIPLKLFYAY